jgi:DNA gyrase subunit A
MGVSEIIDEWLAWRTECVRRELYFDLSKMKEKLHLLYGLEKLLLDIDKAISIIRKTENEKDVIPNLMRGFDVDETQAEYIAEIKLRNLNKEYIIKRISEKEELEKKISETDEILHSERKVKSLISKQLSEIKKKYARARKTEIVYEYEEHEIPSREPEKYPVTVLLTNEGYFKKLLPAKGDKKATDDQTLKAGDAIKCTLDISNEYDILFFTDEGNVYKAKADDFDVVKPSSLGEYIPVKLGFAENEKTVSMLATADYKGDAAIFFENGKALSIPLAVYETKTNRKKLTNGFFKGSKAAGIFFVPEHTGRGFYTEYILKSSAGKYIIMNSSQLTKKVTRTSSGATVFTLKKGHKVESVKEFYDDGSEEMKNFSKFRKSKLPSAGTGVGKDDQESLF